MQLAPALFSELPIGTLSKAIRHDSNRHRAWAFVQLLLRSPAMTWLVFPRVSAFRLVLLTERYLDAVSFNTCAPYPECLRVLA
eukprot:6200936-Pleurochrysis_carterae.AAC.1